MKYAQIKQLAKALKNQGAINKSFSLNQKADILIAEIKENITKVDRKKISPELAAILLDFTILAINYKPEATKTPQKTTKKTVRPAKKRKITQKEFNKKLIEVYLKEKRRQEEEGIVAITTSIIEKLLRKEGIDAETFEKLYNTAHGVFKANENGKELIQLTLEKLDDGTYQLVKNTTGSQAA